MHADGVVTTYSPGSGVNTAGGTDVAPNDFALACSRHGDPNTAGEYACTGYVIVGC